MTGINIGVDRSFLFSRGSLKPIVMMSELFKHRDTPTLRKKKKKTT